MGKGTSNDFSTELTQNTNILVTRGRGVFLGIPGGGMHVCIQILTLFQTKICMLSSTPIFGPGL